MIEQLGQRAVAVKPVLACADTVQKNDALKAIAQALLDRTQEIIDANRVDISSAEKNGMSKSLIDRLMLTPARISGISSACLEIVGLDDPVGVIDSGLVRPNGLRIVKTRVPLGVVGMIYEARPNVTVDAAALCIKSGNVAILRGGKEAFNSNKALAGIIRDALESVGLPKDCVMLVESTTRESSEQMMKCSEYIDVLIPRGGAGLISSVVQNSTVPVIETGTGNCHAYVDATANLDMAVNIVDNAKTSRPSVCNALETCLVHRAVAEDFLPMLKARLDVHNVEIRGCELTKMILGDSVVPATEKDYATEFLDYVLAVKVVDDTLEAIEHIRKYSTGHSECIITESLLSAEEFQRQIDSAAVYVNASTRFTDGGEFGLGAEIGISTQKLHARGPLGLRELTSMKYLINGNGQIR